MSKRLQVLLDEAELRDIQRTARAERVTVAEWVRRVLRTARQAEPTYAAEHKLRAVREAVAHRYPAGPIEDMLAEIEQGYHEDAS
ncbi:MAG: hypothetical protein WD934_04625 [Gemmatimonadales bacterium]